MQEAVENWKQAQAEWLEAEHKAIEATERVVDVTEWAIRQDVERYGLEKAFGHYFWLTSFSLSQEDRERIAEWERIVGAKVTLRSNLTFQVEKVEE